LSGNGGFDGADMQDSGEPHGRSGLAAVGLRPGGRARSGRPADSLHAARRGPTGAGGQGPGGAGQAVPQGPGRNRALVRLPTAPTRRGAGPDRGGAKDRSDSNGKERNEGSGGGRVHALAARRDGERSSPGLLRNRPAEDRDTLPA